MKKKYKSVSTAEALKRRVTEAELEELLQRHNLAVVYKEPRRLYVSDIDDFVDVKKRFERGGEDESILPDSRANCKTA
jgi:hypothetical protein